jgi:paraquat-inducible protein B
MRVAWIWLVPLVAALAALSMAVHTWLQTGPEVTIIFESAEGLEVDKTPVRYKNVDVGVVTSIRLNEDRTKVLVKARLAKDAADLASEDTHFWVVRPRLSVSGVSGLGTLLSGAYIGVDAPVGKSRGDAATKLIFKGLESPPPIAHDRPGKRFFLKAGDLGSLDIGTPVYFRRIMVGRVIGYQLDKTGRTVNVEVFIDAPNDQFVTTSTRFWNASGMDLRVNADGLQVRTESLVSLALGGVAFESISQRDNQLAAGDSSFDLYPNEKAAKANPDGVPFPIRMRFNQSVRGLTVGSPIDFNGITLGYVSQINMDFSAEKKQFYAVVDATLYPDRLGAVYDKIRQLNKSKNALASQQLITMMVQRGLRAQLRSSNLLTGQLYIALDMFREAKSVDYKFTEPATIPTITGNLEQLQQQVSNIVTKMEKIPFDKIGGDLHVMLNSTARLMDRLEREVTPETRDLLRQARDSLAAINTLLAPDAPLPMNTVQAMQELSRAARSLRTLADFLQTHPEALVRGRPSDAIPRISPVIP